MARTIVIATSIGTLRDETQHDRIFIRRLREIGILVRIIRGFWRCKANNGSNAIVANAVIEHSGAIARYWLSSNHSICLRDVPSIWWKRDTVKACSVRCPVLPVLYVSSRPKCGV